MAHWLTNPGLIPGHSSVAVICGVSHRHGSDLVLLWLWCRPTATEPIHPLAWEPPYAMGLALKRQKKKKKKKKFTFPFLEMLCVSLFN